MSVDTTEVDDQLSNMSPAELQELSRKIEREYEARYRATLEELFDKMRAMADDAGVKLEEVIEAGAKRKNKRPIKFRHPDDASLTWSGAGKRPMWINKWLDEGGTLEALSI